jgi:protein-tyrosine-phosphatase
VTTLPEPAAESAVAGGHQPLVAALAEATSATDLLRATAALARHLEAAAEPAAEAITALVQVLGYNNPGAAVAAVEGLIGCGEAAVAPLLANLDAHNYGARAWAVRALAGIGDVRGLALLEDALATDIGPSVRRAAARGLGQLRCQNLEPEERQQVQGRALEALEAASADAEWVVRYAVAVGLESLAAGLPPLQEPWRRAVEALKALGQESEDTPVVRLRARRALERLQAEGIEAEGTEAEEAKPPIRVLFVCLGNICRSPAAEGVFLHLLARRGLEAAFEVDSAGTGSWHVGQLADKRMRAAAEQRGIALTSRARQLHPTDLAHYHHVLTMDADNLAAVQALARAHPSSARIAPLTLHCRRLRSHEVPDPYYGGPEGFDQVLDLLEDACHGLLSALLEEEDPARPLPAPGPGTDPPAKRSPAPR